ncbi:MAG: MBOAT family protein, partial [Kiritimatiellae bacterium]|nr:MBOAT family protein [Kiritimatiellia bacterium]
AMSYLVDVYRGIPAQRNPIDLALYIALFPQLIAGPIVRYNTIAEQICCRVVTADKFADGVHRFLVGFNKKMLLANLFASTADMMFAEKSLSVCSAWLGALCYTFQIFFDFGGYSDMAIGLGKMFGFEFLENFNYPYISRSITEFWRRWHISLGTWFRDYVYFPLGGSRVESRLRLVFNLSVVWLATGIWHGANWTFILWGCLYGALIIFEKIFDIPGRIERSGRIGWVMWIPTFIFVVLGWVLFRSADISSAAKYLGTMFGIDAAGFMDGKFVFELGELRVLLIAAIVASTPWIRYFHEKFGSRHETFEGWLGFVGRFIQIPLFIVGVSYLAMNSHNPFIYFNF